MSKHTPLQPAGTSGPVTLVLLHGLLRTPRVMSGLSRKLEQATGLRTINLGYPSRSQPLASLAKGVAAEILQEVGSQGQVFIITHSMGGIVFRHIMGMPDTDVRWVGAVMLAPPNNGSALANTIMQAWGIGPLFKVIYGQAAVQLGSEVARNASWPLPSCPCGVIAGTRSKAVCPPLLWLTAALSLADEGSDGTVSVPETRLPPECETDFATVHAIHSRVINHPDTLPLVMSFLQHHRFQPPSLPDAGRPISI